MKATKEDAPSISTHTKTKKVLPRKDVQKATDELSYIRERTALMPDPIKVPELIDKSLHEGKLYKSKINTEVLPQCIAWRTIPMENPDEPYTKGQVFRLDDSSSQGTD